MRYNSSLGYNIPLVGWDMMLVVIVFISHPTNVLFVRELPLVGWDITVVFIANATYNARGDVSIDSCIIG